MEIRSLAQQDSRQVADLHITSISTGFISSLGLDFVTSLYEAIAQSRHSFGFTAEENGKVLGFVAFTTDSNLLIDLHLVEVM